MSRQAESSPAGGDQSTEGLDGLLNRLSGHIDSEKLRGRHFEKRADERKPAKLIFEYRVAGDERSYGGRVLDISSGGLRCLVSEDVGLGDVLAISIKSPRPGVLEGRIEAYGEVVRIRRRGNVRELGVGFVRPGISPDAPPERRLHKRSPVAFELTVRTGDGRTALADVRNVSAGGVSFWSDQAFSPGEEIALSLGPGRSPGMEGTLSSVARVTRVRRFGDHQEVAAAFLG